MSALAKFRIYGIVLALAIFGIDQWVKNFVVEDLGLTRVGDHYPLLPFFDFTRTNNYGVSLGMFEATSMEMRWILVAGTAAIALVVLVWMLREKLLGEILALGLVLGGALGNIRDRYLYGYVIDYADLHIGDFRPFLIFNVADAAITIGVVIILARALFMREKPSNEQDAATE
ncbi:signal peptidase II [Aurantiacibacter rhizosphaerae]|uniref:Lipoprotein signal peptidase n=1 Tax=Aurantiacibacter rhizosphaerae TaxID=2691582 RepID=A0A844XGH9_9SPHN|nr:signal peptidase II [Aurantiacibacter rhizosphaerae]MWV28694.1 signal peptidase II [Aurantiacibacter rhizosphaerae]